VLQFCPFWLRDSPTQHAMVDRPGEKTSLPSLYFPCFPVAARPSLLIPRPPSPPRRGKLAQATRRRRSARVEGPASAEPTTSAPSRPFPAPGIPAPPPLSSFSRLHSAAAHGEAARGRVAGSRPRSTPPQPRRKAGSWRTSPTPAASLAPYFASFAELGLGLTLIFTAILACRLKKLVC